ncbi:IPT/TIG domain-containing protein [Tieghemostelium lacteum]|uniref:IPT/TIG domain-containing protein n=1 Tax=Tieghemostelium lacteum TaxID=361077 RepID=A0A151ZJR0_TIELA|nr:IPT/TIG domain-containing protein [Tieghemostelium lacteum]|eukprot:KYQ94120.1 IPT/TIG domain-containing protein [Tieghemostelium lacteum]
MIWVDNSVSIITSVTYYNNTKTILNLIVQYNGNGIPTIDNITTDSSGIVYYNVICYTSAGDFNCFFYLSARSQSEVYTINYKQNSVSMSPFSEFIKIGNIYLGAVSQSPIQSPSLTFTGRFIKPYSNQLHLKVTAGILNNTYNFLNSDITYSDSGDSSLDPAFTISLVDGVGPISLKIYHNDILKVEYNTSYQNPIISSIVYKNDEITINGNNFGLQQFSIYSTITVDDKLLNNLTFSRYSNSDISFPFKNINAQISQVKIMFESIVSNVYPITFSPLPKSLVVINNLKSILIAGERLNTIRKDGQQSNITVSINSYISCTAFENKSSFDNTLIKCNLDKGLELNSSTNSLMVTIDSLQSPILYWVSDFPIPRLITYNQLKNGDLELIGENLGNENHRDIAIYINDQIAVTSHQDVNPTLPLELYNFKNGELMVIQGNQNVSIQSNSLWIDFVPYISGISSRDETISRFKGGIITISGQYLHLSRYNGSKTIVSIYPNCSDIQGNDNGTEIICTLLGSPETTLSVTIDNQQSNTFTLPYSKIKRTSRRMMSNGRVAGIIIGSIIGLFLTMVIIVNLNSYLTKRKKIKNQNNHTVTEINRIN